MRRFLYSSLARIAAPVALAATAWRGLRDPAYRERLPERLGFTQLRFATPPIWIHAVSVGEVQAAAVLARALLESYPQYPLLITTATPTGAQRVRALFGESVRHSYLPYDLPGAVRRFLDRVRPRIAIVMEREIWPNLFHECRQRRISIVLASARLSSRSVERYRFGAALIRAALGHGVAVAAQTAEDAERFRALGADPARVTVAGNIKFDMRIAADVQQAGETLRVQQFPGRPVWIAGSTHAGEEDAVLAAHMELLAARPDALLLLAPRHPQRFEEVRAWLRERRVAYAMRSQAQAANASHCVLLIDTLGELMMFYAAADVAFVGGSLVPIGGHNLLEPAALARPVVVGPHNFNAPDVAELLLAGGAALEVRDAQQLGKTLGALFSDPTRRQAIGERGRAAVEANRGALQRVLEIVARALS
jgi:3-deoxy-D-manno-octulosonic-acid transferase